MTERNPQSAGFTTDQLRAYEQQQAAVKAQERQQRLLDIQNEMAAKARAAIEAAGGLGS